MPYADHARDVVVELLADRQQAGTIIWIGDDAVAAELAAEDFDLGLQRPDAGVPACCARFDEEV